MVRGLGARVEVHPPGPSRRPRTPRGFAHRPLTLATTGWERRAWKSIPGWRSRLKHANPAQWPLLATMDGMNITPQARVVIGFGRPPVHLPWAPEAGGDARFASCRD